MHNLAKQIRVSVPITPCLSYFFRRQDVPIRTIVRMKIIRPQMILMLTWMKRKHMWLKAMTFSSEVASYSFYNKYAKENGFSVRHEKIKKDIDKSGTPTIRYRRFLCSRAGTRERKYLTMEGRGYRHRTESCYYCGTHLSVSRNKKKGFGQFWDFTTLTTIHRLHLIKSLFFDLIERSRLIINLK
jgi:hypothetical protein